MTDRPSDRIREGLTFDDDGYLYVAQDPGGIRKFRVNPKR